MKGFSGGKVKVKKERELIVNLLSLLLGRSYFVTVRKSFEIWKVVRMEMEGSVGVVGRSVGWMGSPLRGSEEVKEAMKTLFWSGSKEGTSKCQMCLSGRRSVELGVEVVGVVLQALLIPSSKEESEGASPLWLCGTCESSLTSLTDLFLQLENLRGQFNDLRMRVGREVIVGALGRSEDEWVEWEEEAKGLEDTFPSCVKLMGEEPKEFGDFCDIQLEEEEEEEDVKLKMRPVVVLEKLKEYPGRGSEPSSKSFRLEEKKEEAETGNEKRDGGYWWEESPFDGATSIKDQMEEDSFSDESEELLEKEEDSEENQNVADSLRHCLKLMLTTQAGRDEAKREKERRKLKCPSCPQAYELQTALDRHVFTQHPPSGHPCKECGKSFRSKQALRNHAKSVHEGGGPSDCSVCGKTFARRALLQCHVRYAHSASSTSTCPHCSASFKAAKPLRQHLYNLHREETIKANPHPCLICFHTFPRGEDLKVHMKLHAHLKCPICGAMSPHPKHLKSHLQRQHWGSIVFNMDGKGKAQ